MTVHKLLTRAQEILKKVFPQQAAEVAKLETEATSVCYPAFIGSGRVMRALNLSRIVSPSITFVEEPAIYRIRPGDVYQSVSSDRNFGSRYFDITHPDVEKHLAYLMVPDAVTAVRALAVTTPLSLELAHNPVDVVYVCLERRLTDENLSSIRALLETVSTHAKAVPIYCLQLSESMDPAEAEQLFLANLESLQGIIEVNDAFQIAAVDQTDTEYTRFQGHLEGLGAKLQAQHQSHVEQKAVEILQSCRESSIDQRRLIGVKKYISPEVPSPATLAQRENAKRASAIKSELMAIFKTVNGKKKGESLLKKVMKLIENAKTPGDFEQAILRACLLINNGTIDALKTATESLNTSYMGVLDTYLEEINTVFAKAGYPRVKMPPLAPFVINENAGTDEIEFKPALMTRSDALFRLVITGSIGSGTTIALISLLTELGVLTGAAAGPIGQAVGGVAGFTLGLLPGVFMIESANTKILAFEYEKRVRETIFAVGSEADSLFTAVNIDVHYAASDALSLIERQAYDTIKAFEEKWDAFNGMSDAELDRLGVKLETVADEIEALLDAEAAHTEDADAETDVEADVDDAGATDAADAETDVEADVDDADATDAADADPPDAADADDADADAEKR